MLNNWTLLMARCPHRHSLSQRMWEDSYAATALLLAFFSGACWGWAGEYLNRDPGDEYPPKMNYHSFLLKHCVLTIKIQCTTQYYLVDSVRTIPNFVMYMLDSAYSALCIDLNRLVLLVDVNWIIMIASLIENDRWNENQENQHSTEGEYMLLYIRM